MMKLLICFAHILLVFAVSGSDVSALQDQTWNATIEAATQRRWHDVVKQTNSIDRNRKVPVQVYLVRAMALMNVGRPADAARVATIAIARDPTVIESYLTAAEARRQANQHDSALIVLKAALRSFPDDARLLLSIGISLAVTGRCNEAIAPLEDAMFKRPENVTIAKQLAQCLAAEDRSQEAAELYGRLLDTEPNDKAVRIALAELMVILSLKDSAATLYSQVFSRDTTDVRAALAYSSVLHDLGRSAEAVTLLRRITTIAPDSADVWYNIGIVQFASGMPDSAIRSYRRAISLRSTFPEALFNLGLAYETRGFVEDAVVAFKRCVVQSKALAPSAYNRIAETLRNQNRIDDAIEYHNQAAAFDTTNMYLLAAKGHTLLLGNRYEEAISYLEPLVKQHPNSPDLLHALARNYVRIGKKSEALAIAEELDRTKPDFAKDIREMMR